MDPLTHTLTGVALGRAGLARRHGAGTTLLLAIASNVPDVDAVLMFGGPDAAMSRRTLTHSVVGVPLLALGLALVFRWRYRARSLAALFGLSLLGAGLHVVMDLLNSYGVVLFYPLSRVRLELAWVFIIDLAIWAILLAPYVLRLTPARRFGVERWYRASLAVLAVYVGTCALAHWRATGIVRDVAAAEGLHPDFTYAFPEPLGPQRFRGVAREGDDYVVALVHVLDGSVDPASAVHTDAGLPEIRAVRATPRAQRVERFFKAPVWRLDRTRDVAEVEDLRFRSAVLAQRRGAFVYTFPLEHPP